VTLQFASRILKERTVYYKGTGSVYTSLRERANRESSIDLAKVQVSGGIDSTLPTVSISNPAGNTATHFQQQHHVAELQRTSPARWCLRTGECGEFAQATLQTLWRLSLPAVVGGKERTRSSQRPWISVANEQLSAPRSIAALC
jgi:hypothetical protein